jgi:hypothetical protein
MPDTFTNAHRVEITPLAARYRLPAAYPFHFFAEIGEPILLQVLRSERATALTISLMQQRSSGIWGCAVVPDGLWDALAATESDPGTDSNKSGTARRVTSAGPLIERWACSSRHVRRGRSSSDGRALQISPDN